MTFGKSFATFNNSLLPWPQCKSTLLNLPSSLDHVLHQIQQVEPPHMIIFPFKSYSNKFLSSILAIGDLQRNSTFCLDFCPQTFFPSQSFEPSTKIPEDPLVFSSKFSNYTCCKFGPDLSNLVKFIQILLQKFQVKSGSLWVH